MCADQSRCVRGSVEEKVKGSRVVDQRTHLDFSVAPEKGLGVARWARRSPKAEIEPLHLAIS